MDVDRLKKNILLGNYELTLHVRQRLGLRKISMEEVKTAIINGEMIECYPDSRPYPACLMMGKVRDGFPLYVVCALSEERTHLITAHWMDPDKWLDPKTRRDKL